MLEVRAESLLAKRKRVGGWLLFFCISILILSPLITWLDLYTLYLSLVEYFDSHPHIFLFFLAVSAISIGLVGFGIYAGISLVMIRPNAVSITKNLLITNFVCTLIFLFLFINTESAGEQFTIFLRTLLWFVIWHSYFRKSKRVKATYGASAVDEFIGLGLSSRPVQPAPSALTTSAESYDRTLEAPAEITELTEEQNKRNPLETLPPKKRALKRMEW